MALAGLPVAPAALAFVAPLAGNRFGRDQDKRAKGTDYGVDTMTAEGDAEHHARHEKHDNAPCRDDNGLKVSVVGEVPFLGQIGGYTADHQRPPECKKHASSPNFKAGAILPPDPLKIFMKG